MNKIFASFLVVFLAHVQVRAESSEVKVTSNISRVTVFMQGAQVYRTGSANIPKGSSVLIFEGVSPYIQQHSLKASGKGSFTIMDIQYRYFYPEPTPENTEEKDRIQIKINRLQDSINKLNLVIQNVQEKKTAIQTEKRLLINHPLLTGKGKPDSLDLLKGTMSYIEIKLATLADRMLKMQQQESVLNKEMTGMQQRLRDLQIYLNNRPRIAPQKPIHQVLVTVAADKAVYGQIEINYKVNNAGWAPWYDITAKTDSDLIDLVYKAAVYQNTEEDWDNVQLRISNANPNQSNIKPVLPNWYLDFYRKVVAVKKEVGRADRYFKYETKEKSLAAAEMRVITDNVTEDEVSLDANVISDMSYQYTTKMQNFSSIEFDIAKPYYIKSGSRTKFVTVQKHELKSNFKHYLVPKLDNDAFVVAHITDWENLDLLLGNANIYFGESYVGRTVIDPEVLSDTLEISMGRYRSVAVKRTKLTSNTKKQVVGAHQVYTGTYQIEVRNNSKKTLDLVIEDQIPLTRNEEIEIELTEADGGRLDKASGLMTWDVQLEPNAKRVITFTYTVKYPKDQRITGL